MKLGNDHLNEPRGKVGFTGNPDADDLLDDSQRAGQPARSASFFASASHAQTARSTVKASPKISTLRAARQR